MRVALLTVRVGTFVGMFIIVYMYTCIYIFVFIFYIFIFTCIDILISSGSRVKAAVKRKESYRSSHARVRAIRTSAYSLRP